MATIIGSEGPDVLVETTDSDTIQGLAGDDIIILNTGQATGTETIDGGAGSDRLIIYSGTGSLQVHANQFSSPRITNGPFIPGNWQAFLTSIEHYTIYATNRDSITTGSGDDIYYYTATNDQINHGGPSSVWLGGGNDLVSIDGSALVDYGIEISIHSGRRLVFVGSMQRLELTEVDRLHVTGGALADRITALAGDDILDGRDGNDILNGLGGNDRLTGGNGNDTLNGGEGDDVLNFSTGTDTVDGGNGSDRLEIDARGSAGAVAFSVASGPPYSGSFTHAGGTVTYSGIESFTIFSNAGNFADDVVTGAGDDIFYHYGLNDLSYAVDEVDLGGGSNDLLVADFSAVTNHAVVLPSDPLPNGHYQFTVGGNAKLDFTGVERIHFIGGAQADDLFGHEGNDILEGRGGDDELYGYGGNDDISPGTGNNRVNGDDGDDILRISSLGTTTAFGGSGFDTAIIDYSDTTANVSNTSGNSIAYTHSFNSTVSLAEFEKIIITTGSGQDSIITQGGDDVIRSGAGTDAIGGGDGNDYLDGGPGGDDMTGWFGDDVFIVDNVFDFVMDEHPAGGTDTIYASVATYTLRVGVENMIAIGGSHARTFRGNAGNNSLTGEAGNDTLLLQDGGEDDAFGLSGNDVVYFGAAYTGADYANGGDGRDAVVLQGNYVVTLAGSNLVGFESISLQSGANTQFGDTANNFYDFNITTANDLVAAGQQLIVNAQSLRAGEDFTFDGSAESDGKFLIYGGHGVDNLTGGAGVDVFFFEGGRWSAGDKANGGGGRDSVVISGVSGLNLIEFADDSLTSIESISLNNFYASDPTQVPSYEIVLANGNVAPGGTLIVNGNSLGAGQVANIDGSAVMDGNLMLFGGAGNDVLTASEGADLLLGAGGADELEGGSRGDVFRYDSTSDSTAAATDTIVDFETGLDKIDLSRIDADTHAAGNQIFHWIGSNAFSGNGAASEGELRVFQSSGQWFAEGDTNGDGVADLVIAFQPGTAAPVQGDFVL